MSYVQKAFETNWIGPQGENIDALERKLASYTGVPDAVALSSGTAAIHLGLKYLGVKEGDEVFCSDVTFAASCNPIVYEKAIPVFIDSDRHSHNMSPVALERAFQDVKKRGKLPKAVVIVDLYGLPANYAELLPICEAYGVPVLEDAAEALGSIYRGKKCGSFGEIGVLSFNSNKIITTSGGGMALCSGNAAAKIKFWASQSREPASHYEHKELGYNYRLSNICAGIGLGQFETLDEYVKKRVSINNFYRDALKNLPIEFCPIIDGAEPNFWLTVIFVRDNCNVTRDMIIEALTRENIESRPYWKPMHTQPVFAGRRFFPDSGKPVGEDLFRRGLCLPSSSFLREGELDEVAGTIKALFS